MDYYPIQDYGPVMKGLVIGGLGIFHVFLAQFAIGGGILMAWFQWLAMSGREPAARRFLDSYYPFLVLVSFVTGALTGVGMWFTTIQVSPQTIGLLLEEFHWLWATEWTFFCLEIAAGYAFLRCGRRLSDRWRLGLLIVYSAAAWMSLFWINGILAFQLTPGGWTPEGRDMWSGFFNPSFFPSLLYRTVACLAIAGLAGCLVINFMKDVGHPARKRLVGRASVLLLPMLAMPVLGLWYLGVIPEESRRWVLGGSVAMTLFLNLAVGASAILGVYAIVGLYRKRLYVNAATTTLLLVLAFAATAGGEFVREGIRKPFTVRGFLYSNAITPDIVAELRVKGSVTDDPYPLKDADAYPTEQLRLGARVFRLQCSVCHTISGVNGLTHLAGSWGTDQKRMNIAKLQQTKPFMPPFAGTPSELEALVQLLEWEGEDRPGSWSPPAQAGIEERIRRWLDEAGTEPTVGGGR